jgi:hypothetical protein
MEFLKSLSGSKKAVEGVITSGDSYRRARNWIAAASQAVKRDLRKMMVEKNIFAEMHRRDGNVERKRRRLVFFHLPKCGGTTVHASLSDIFDPSEIFLHHGEVNDEGLQRSFVVTHAPFTDVVVDLERDWLITTLRDPIRRLRSLYQYWSSVRLGPFELGRPPNDNRRAVRMAHELSFEDYLRSQEPAVASYTDNGLVRHFTQVDGPVTEAHFQRACRNLEKINQFVFAENLETGLSAVFDALGKLTAFEMRTENVTATLAELKPDVHHEPREVGEVEALFESDEAIASRVKWDNRLYTYGLSLANERNKEALTPGIFPATGMAILEIVPDVVYEFDHNPRLRKLLWGAWSDKSDTSAWTLGNDASIRFKVKRSAIDALTSPGVTIEVHASLPATRRTNQVDFSVAGEAATSRVVFLNQGFAVELPGIAHYPPADRTLVIANWIGRLNFALSRSGILLEDPNTIKGNKDAFATFRIDLKNIPALRGSLFGMQDHRTLGISLKKLEVRDLVMLNAS